MSAAFDRSATLVNDPAITDYVERVAESVARNSDASVPITVRLIDSDEPAALTLPGGYQYINRGLLLRLQNEGELASALARGIAHTALRSATLELTRLALLQSANIPVITFGQIGNAQSPSKSTVSLVTLRFRQLDELDADYFGAQYVYKAGYDSGCFASFVQRIWGPSPGTANTALSKAFDPFPPLPERLRALQKEGSAVVPTLINEVGSISEFEEFQKRLRAWKPDESGPKQPDEEPLLLREHDGN